MPWRNDPEKRQRDAQHYGAEYRRKRLECLRRARWRCEIRLEGCQGSATETDHEAGAANDPHHESLRAACKSCHSKITARQGHDARSSKPLPDPPARPVTKW